MVRKDYETLDVRRETSRGKEMGESRELNLKYKEENPLKPVNKGGRADIFKKRHS